MKMLVILILTLVLGLLFVTMVEAQDRKIRPERFSFIWGWETNGVFLASGTWMREGPTTYDLWNLLAKTSSNFSQVECAKASKSCEILTAYVLNGLLTLQKYSFEVKSFTNETIIATFSLHPDTVLIIRRNDMSVTVDSIGAITKERKREMLKNGYTN
jgi:hypothetical protein